MKRRKRINGLTAIVILAIISASASQIFVIADDMECAPEVDILLEDDSAITGDTVFDDVQDEELWIEDDTLLIDGVADDTAVLEDDCLEELEIEEIIADEEILIEEEQSEIQSEGQSDFCGFENDAVYWNLEAGTLTISGEGRMMDWENAEDVPWFEFKESITRIVVEDQITTIGNNAFVGCENAQEILIPESIERIGESACAGCNGIEEITIG